MKHMQEKWNNSKAYSSLICGGNTHQKNETQRKLTMKSHQRPISSIHISWFIAIVLLTACAQATPTAPTKPAPSQTASITETPNHTPTSTIQVPTNTPLPATATPTATVQFANEFSDEHGSVDIKIEQPSLEDLKTVPNLWDYATSTESKDLSAPGTRDLSFTLDSDAPLLLPWYWCAKEEQMEENLQHLKVEYQINNKPVPAENILQSATDQAPTGFACQQWVTKISWGMNSYYNVAITYRFDQTISDGTASYARGNYILNLNIGTTYKKLIKSNLYGFSVTIPDTLGVRSYNAASDESIASLSWPFFRVPGTGQITTSSNIWVENNTDRCHAQFFAPIESTKEEQVTINGIPFIMAYTPELSKPLYEQELRYMTYNEAGFCVHFSSYFHTSYFDQGNAIPGNMIPYIKPTLERLLSTFKWITP
jgi:hypothetical protein